MVTIFISYAQVDRGNARPLAEFLQASGYAVWWDAGLRPGDIFTTEIQRQIQNSQHFIVLWSKVSAASFWVTAETTYANTYNKPILPLRIDDCLPPVPFNVLQTLDFAEIDRDGPAIIEALIAAGTLPTRIADVEVNGTAPRESMMRQAQELARWEFIKSSTSVEDFRVFLKRFPTGDLADLAAMRLESLRWDEVCRNRTIETLSEFMKEFPNGVKTPQARRCREKRQRALEQSEWSRLNWSISGWSRAQPERLLASYERFLDRFPAGAFAEQARRHVERFRGEIGSWRTASRGDQTAVERYLLDYPRGAHVTEAKALLARLRCQSKPAPADGGDVADAMPSLSFPTATFVALSFAALGLGCLGAYLGQSSRFLVSMPFHSVWGETIYFLHPYPLLIGSAIAFLIHKWGNRSWLTTVFAFFFVLAFRFASQFVGISDEDVARFPVYAMAIGVLYCLGAWTAGFIVAPYMRRSISVFLISVVLGAICYPNWPAVLGMQFHGDEVVTAGVFFMACTMPIAYSLLRSPPATAAA